MSGSGALESSVTLDEVFSVLGAKRVPLAPELAGYLVLEIAEHADPAGGDVDPKSVFVGEEGTVALVKPRRDVVSGDVEASVRSVLAKLLDASGSQTPALSLASKRKSGMGLPALAAELETALIPVNRAAGRRALARLAREVRRILLGVGRNALASSSDVATSSRRSVASGPPASADTARASNATFSREDEATTTKHAQPNDPQPSKGRASEWPDLPTTQFAGPGRSAGSTQADVDALINQFGVSAENVQEQASALKAMAGLEPTPPPPLAGDARLRLLSPANAGRSEDAEVESLLALDSGAPQKPEPPASAPATRARPASTQTATRPSRLSRASIPVPTRKTRGFIFPVLALVAIGGGVYAVRELRPGPAPHESPTADTTASVAAPVRTAPACNASLVVTNVPTQAEVLLREGQAPVDVEKMPIGARLEFVATAEGYAPKRVVIPAAAAWDRGSDGKPRFEAAVQLDATTMKAGAGSWPPSEPASEVGGEGPPGTVRVVATPRGAEIWMLAGIGPEARVERLRCDRDIDVLVAGPTTFRKRLHVSESDFAPQDMADSTHRETLTRIARVSAK